MTEFELTMDEDDTTPAPTLTPGFDAFYAAYPRKVAKGAARKAWAQMVPDAATAKLIIVSIKKRVATDLVWLNLVNNNELKYIPHPATWLRAEQWEDDYEQAKSRKIKPLG